MDDLIVQFARLWGQYETLNLTDKDREIADMLKSYDSIELRDLLQQWADEFYSNSKYEDTVEFFEQKVEEMYSAEHSLETRQHGNTSGQACPGKAGRRLASRACIEKKRATASEKL